MLSLVLPKGSLEQATLDLFDAADLTVRRSSDRDYHASIDDPRIDRVRFLRPQEIPSYLERGLFDLGITGRDWIAETEADVVSLGELQYSKASSQPVRVVLAVPVSASWQSAADLPEGIRISTEFPSLTRRFLEARGVKAMVVPSYGATEAKVPDIVDAIVDLTETGSSLRKNGLRILETLLSSYTELIASAPAYADVAKRAAMEDIALLLRGAIQARGHVLLKLNVPADRLAAVTEMLPALSSPTITALARPNMNAVETVVPKRGVNTLIPALKAAGAQDILEIPISKIVELSVQRFPGGTTPPDPAAVPTGGTHPPGPPLGETHPPAPLLRRKTARVLPVDPAGRVLLLHGWDPHRPEVTFWFTIGGAVEKGDGEAGGESLRDAAIRELREEAGISVDPAELGEPIAENTIEFSWGGHHVVQDQVFYAVPVTGAEVSLDGLDEWERATTDTYGWLTAEDLEHGERPAHPDIPDLVRTAVAAIRARGQ
jgi:ATP phosphoribosyltransferase